MYLSIFWVFSLFFFFEYTVFQKIPTIPHISPFTSGPPGGPTDKVGSEGVGPPSIIAVGPHPYCNDRTARTCLLIPDYSFRDLNDREIGNDLVLYCNMSNAYNVFLYPYYNFWINLNCSTSDVGKQFMLQIFIMSATCSKCGATNNGVIVGFRPCHLRYPPEDHIFFRNTGKTQCLISCLFNFCLSTHSS